MYNATFSNTWAQEVTPHWNQLICSLNCPRAKRDTPGPENGFFFAWFAGFGVMDANGSLTQWIHIPQGRHHLSLSFWIQINSTGPNDSELVFLLGNQTLVSYTYKDTPSFPRWTLVSKHFEWGEGDALLNLSYFSITNPKYFLTHYFVDNVYLQLVQ